MAVSDEFKDFILDRLEGIGQITARRMFGGLGLYMDGMFFALASDNILYFKVNENNLPDYQASGAKPFKPFGEKSYAMSYYEVPAEILDDDDALREWAMKALDAARESLNSRETKKRRRKIRPNND
ncbi:MAG: TfoX/Sxy family protein [Candidatus Zixiibacteriota bacterium]|nr:MAG: TfoX/Sxy family protein [candidate division Zixibacteria bacterium]